MVRKLISLFLLVVIAACASENSLADELPLDDSRPTFVMFYTQP